jgi:hypothetical protein
MLNDLARTRIPGYMALLSTVFLGIGPSQAADLGEPPQLAEPAAPPSPWTFSLTPYGWLPWLTGDLVARNRKFDVQANPIQILDNLDWSTLPVWMSYAEARNGRLTLFNDIVYAKLAGSKNFATVRQGAAGTLSLGGDIEADYTQAIVELGGAYELWAQGTAHEAGYTAFDVLAGGRYWHQDVSISGDLNATLAIDPGLSGLTISGSRAIARSGAVNWVDPFIGARLRHELTSGQELMLRGDLGGFGVGSDFTWQVLATVNSKICAFQGLNLDAYLGYRALSVDYAQGSGMKRYEYDVVQHGPVLGVTAHF